MTDLELEQWLARLPVRAPDTARERELLATLRTPRAAQPAWWARPIPLWQAAAACIGVFSLSLLWRHDAPQRAPAAVELVIVRVDQPLFASASAANERIDPSRWASLPSGGQ